jgi:hypothetical protein
MRRPPVLSFFIKSLSVSRIVSSYPVSAKSSRNSMSFWTSGKRFSGTIERV